MDMRNNKRRNVLTNARVTFSQLETSSFLRGGGGSILSFYCGGELAEKIQMFEVSFILLLQH